MREYIKHGASIKFIGVDGADILNKVIEAHLSVAPNCHEFLSTVEMTVIKIDDFESFTYRTENGYTSMIRSYNDIRLTMKSLVLDEVQSYSIFDYKGERIIDFNEPKLYKMFESIDASFMENSLNFMLYVICGEER